MFPIIIGVAILGIVAFIVSRRSKATHDWTFVFFFSLIVGGLLGLMVAVAISVPNADQTTRSPAYQFNGTSAIIQDGEIWYFPEDDGQAVSLSSFSAAADEISVVEEDITAPVLIITIEGACQETITAWGFCMDGKKYYVLHVPRDSVLSLT